MQTPEPNSDQDSATDAVQDTASHPQRVLAVLISGRGSNMVAIAEACRTGRLNARIAQVICNNPNAAGIATAESLGLNTVVINHRNYPNRGAFDDAIHAQLGTVNPDWVVLAGFMRILTPELVQHWSGRILNIHPSLLPLYPGLNTHQQAIDAGATEAGASVHVVTPQLDAGPVVAQVRVPILAEDTAQSLAKRVLEQEHELYISALQRCLMLDTKSSAHEVLN